MLAGRCRPLGELGHGGGVAAPAPRGAPRSPSAPPPVHTHTAGAAQGPYARVPTGEAPDSAASPAAAPGYGPAPGTDRTGHRAIPRGSRAAGGGLRAPRGAAGPGLPRLPAKVAYRCTPAMARPPAQAGRLLTSP